MFFDIYFIVALVLAITVHEFSHAWMATYLGDLTAKYMGRLTINPLAHLDPIGTILLFLAGFGWGKPVPFNPLNLQNPRVGAALISLAGPLSNFALIILFAIPYRYLHQLSAGSEAMIASGSFIFIVLRLFQSIINLNLVLMLFNLLPIPPLDGAKIFSLLIPEHLLGKIYEYRNYGYVVLILIVFSDSLFGFSILGSLLSPVFEFVWSVIL